MHNGDVDIEFDPAKARANLRKHRVSFADAEQALRDPFAVTIDDPDAEDDERVPRRLSRHRGHPRTETPPDRESLGILLGKGAGSSRLCSD